MSLSPLRAGRASGAISVGRPEPEPVSDEQSALLQTFADRAVIALENVWLFTELQARTAQLTRSVEQLQALGEVGHAVGSTLDLEAVLQTIVSRATQLAGMDGGAVYEYDDVRQEFHLHTTCNLSVELIDLLRVTPIRHGEGALGRMGVAGRAVEIRDIVDEGVYQRRVRTVLVRSGYRSLLAVPLLHEGRLVGGLVVNRKAPGEFAPEVIDLLQTFATQSALAIQNARLFRELEGKGHQLEITSQHNSGFLGNMSHELRTPINAIIGFSEVLIERMFGDLYDTQAEYLDDILDSARHLLPLINDILDPSKIEAGRMDLDVAEVDLPRVVESTLVLVKERAHGRGIARESTIDASLGTVATIGTAGGPDLLMERRSFICAGAGVLITAPRIGRAHHAHRILNGATVSEFPLERPTAYELTVIWRTVGLLNLESPQALLLRADEVTQ